jgi:hypothetical protein
VARLCRPGACAFASLSAAPLTSIFTCSARAAMSPWSEMGSVGRGASAPGGRGAAARVSK